MVFAEDGVNIPDQFSRIYALCHTRSAQYGRVETQQHNSECASLEGPWLHGHSSSLLFESLCAQGLLLAMAAQTSDELAVRRPRLLEYRMVAV